MNQADVQFLGKLGSDRDIAEAAWASTAACGNRTDADAARVIRFLARAEPKHWSPFATGAQVKFRLRMPSFLWDQWRKHAIGISRTEADDVDAIADVLWQQETAERPYNSESRRYVDGPLEFMATGVDFWRQRAAGKKSSSGERLWDSDLAVAQEEERQVLLAHFRDYYENSLSRGISPEQARMDIPRTFFSSHIEVGSLYAYARVCLHRIHPEAEGPIRPYAVAVSDILRREFPVAWPALMGEKP